MDLNHSVETLKKLTLEREQDLSVPSTYFFDHIAENEEAMDRSYWFGEADDFYRLILTPIAKRVDSALCISAVSVRRVSATSLVHGLAVLSDKRLFAFYFFDDVKAGMAIVTCINNNRCDFYRLYALPGMPPISLSVH